MKLSHQLRYKKDNDKKVEGVENPTEDAGRHGKPPSRSSIFGSCGSGFGLFKIHKRGLSSQKCTADDQELSREHIHFRRSNISFDSCRKYYRVSVRRVSDDKIAFIRSTLATAVHARSRRHGRLCRR